MHTYYEDHNARARLRKVFRCAACMIHEYPISLITPICGSHTPPVWAIRFASELIPGSLLATTQTHSDCPKDEGRVTSTDTCH